MLIGLIVLCIKKLSGWALALTAGGLLTLSPYFLAMSQVYHVDGLLTALMLLSTLLMLVYIQGKQKRYLILSGLTGGLGLLTKTPALFLLPYAGLALGVDLLLALRADWGIHAGSGEVARCAVLAAAGPAAAYLDCVYGAALRWLAGDVGRADHGHQEYGGRHRAGLRDPAYGCVFRRWSFHLLVTAADFLSCRAADL